MQVSTVTGRIATVLALVMIILVGVAPAASAAPSRAAADRLAFEVDLATFQREARFSGFNWSSDGCSTPAVPDLERWNAVFRSACDRHDFSYGVYGVGGDVAVPTETQRQRIDDQFLRDMNGICIATYTWFRRAECLVVARAYYTVIRQVGFLAYFY
jgi:Prokaryotic phospholipase A2